jgi:hypothetical protein
MQKRHSNELCLSVARANWLAYIMPTVARLALAIPRRTLLRNSTLPMVGDWILPIAHVEAFAIRASRPSLRTRING